MLTGGGLFKVCPCNPGPHKIHLFPKLKPRYTVINLAYIQYTSNDLFMSPEYQSCRGHFRHVFFPQAQQCSLKLLVEPQKEAVKHLIFSTVESQDYQVKTKKNTFMTTEKETPHILHIKGPKKTILRLTPNLSKTDTLGWRLGRPTIPKSQFLMGWE